MNGFPEPADPSWWLSEAVAAQGAAPSGALSGERQVDVAVIGGGYTGLWTALALRERDPALSVAVIEADICGSGASSKNGGKVHGYWGALPGAAKAVGDDNALAMARAGTRAQDGIRSFATAPGRDVWWREAGNIRVSASPSQDTKVAAYVAEAKRLGVPDTAVALSPDEVQARCASPVFRSGVYFPEGANLHPARLARALREAAIGLGVEVYENSRMVGLDRGRPSRVRTEGGQLIAREVVLATNVELAREPTIRPHLTVFSSYALMTEPAPDSLESMGWTGDEGIADVRMFVHYFRRTPDGRVLMGSGSGPIAFDGDTSTSVLRHDHASAARAVRGLRRLLPGFVDVAIAKTWGGAIDVSSDRLPFFGTIPGTRIHYGCGYSGHGVNATYIAGQCLASLVLDQKDAWSTSPFCTRRLPPLPPEPLRYVGGQAIRWGILTCEDAEEQGGTPPILARAAAALPSLFGLRIGTR